MPAEADGMDGTHTASWLKSSALGVIILGAIGSTTALLFVPDYPYGIKVLSLDMSKVIV